MKTNNQNDFSKRTANQISSILFSNGLNLKVENLGDGKNFYINDNSLKTRICIKKSGFILETSKTSDKGLYFRTNN